MFRSSLDVSGVSEVIAAFLWREAIEQVANRVPEVIDGSLGGFSEERLEFGEYLFDRVEVGRIGRQVRSSSRAMPSSRRGIRAGISWWSTRGRRARGWRGHSSPGETLMFSERKIGHRIGHKLNQTGPNQGKEEGDRKAPIPQKSAIFHTN